jgi:multiple sugar transport system ATP-binding protein
MAEIEIRALRKAFDGAEVLKGVDLTIADGEFISLVGPSGCGKSTLLRIIAGLEPQSSGEIWIDGASADGVRPSARNLAMVFQSYALYPHLSVFDNIAFPLAAQHMPRAAIGQKVDWAATLFGIAHLLSRKPRQLSGGERQRVALARAVVREPVAFLLDEPLSNLDAKLRTSAREELQQFQRRLATTTIYVTHDQIEALGLGDRIAILDHGRIHQLGTPQEVYDYPADMFVATFIGSPPMNLVEADGAITGFRPEHFLPREAYPADEVLSRFPFHVTRIENLGSDRLVYGILQPPLTPAKAISRIPCTVTVPIATGMRYDFVVRSRDLKRFDPQTGLRLAAGPP